MSLYEALALFALVCAGSFAYYFYRSDTRPKPPGEEAPEPVSRPMFGRSARDRGEGT
jgi:hypothetical protein